MDIFFQVKHGISVLGLDMDDLGMAEIFLQTLMSWRDTRLQWDPEEYNNVTSVHLDTVDVWVPDIELYNLHGFDAGDVIRRERKRGSRPLVAVDNEGNAMFIFNEVRNAHEALG